MQRLIRVCCAAVALTALAACSDTLVTSPVSKAPGAVSRVLSQTTTPVCSAAGIQVQQHAGLGAGSFGPFEPAIAPSPNVAWHTPLTNSVWIIPNDLGGATPPSFTALNAPDFVTSHYQVSFTMPAHSTATLTGQSWADNQVTQILIDNGGSSIGSNATLSDALNYGFNGAGAPLDYTHDVSALSNGAHTLDFYVANNNVTQPTNPTGIDFCFHVDFNPPASTTWCSPGFWKNHATSPPWPAGYLSLGYNTFSAQYVRDPKTIAGNPSLLTVVSNPKIYGGPATNNVADAISNFIFGTPFGSGIESCPDPSDFPIPSN